MVSVNNNNTVILQQITVVNQGTTVYNLYIYIYIYTEKDIFSICDDLAWTARCSNCIICLHVICGAIHFYPSATRGSGHPPHVTSHLQALPSISVSLPLITDMFKFSLKMCHFSLTKSGSAGQIWDIILAFFQLCRVEHICY